MTVSESFYQYILEQQLKGMKLKTVRNYTSVLHSLLRCMGDIPIGLISLDMVIRWSIYMDDRGNSSSYKSSSLSRLRQVIKYMAKRGHEVMDYEEIELPKILHKPPTFLDYSEIQVMIDHAPNPREKAIIACLFSTGCRITELLSINRADIIDNEVSILGKGDKYRTVYIDATAQEYLQAYLVTRRDNLRPLFISAQRSRITASRVQQQLHEIADWAGIDKNVTPHVFRHSYATDLHRNGAPLLDIKELLGHEKISSTIIYTHVTNHEKRKVFNQYHSKD